jgi:hypothetical protein
MKTTISGLIETLEEIREEHGEVEVRLAHQPSWPLSFALGEVAAVDEAAPDGDEDDEPEDLSEDYPGQRIVGPDHDTRGSEGPRVVVYLGEGGDQEYLSGAASRALGWK